jgi:hypothetical protein
MNSILRYEYDYEPASSNRIFRDRVKRFYIIKFFEIDWGISELFFEAKRIHDN